MPTVSVAESARHARPLKPLVTDGGDVPEGGVRIGVQHESARDRMEAAVPTSLPTSIPEQMSTEAAVTVFGALAGVGGFFAQVLAARKLATLEDGVVAPRSLLMPTLVLSAGVVLAARFLPSAA